MLILNFDYRDTDHYNQTDLKFALPAFVLKQLRKSDTIIDPVIAHRINQQICHAFLKRHLITGFENFQPFSLIITKSFNILDPACQQNVPELDGGEGCLEYIIHGTNVDLSVSTDSNTDEQPGTEPQSSQGTEPQSSQGTESPVDII